MTAPHIVDRAGLLGEALAEASPDLMRSLLQSIINVLLSADADAVVGMRVATSETGRRGTSSSPTSSPAACACGPPQPHHDETPTETLSDDRHPSSKGPSPHRSRTSAHEVGWRLSGPRSTAVRPQLLKISRLRSPSKGHRRPRAHFCGHDRRQTSKRVVPHPPRSTGGARRRSWS
jgi:hypothetical protein